MKNEKRIRKTNGHPLAKLFMNTNKSKANGCPYHLEHKKILLCSVLCFLGKIAKAFTCLQLRVAPSLDNTILEAAKQTWWL